MAIRSQSARRYAHALVDSILESDKNLEPVLKEIDQFNSLLGESFDLKNALMNPTFTAEDRTRVMSAVMRKLDLSPRTQRFLMLLVERDHIRELAEVAEAFHKLADERRGKVRAEVVTAAQLSPDSTERLRRALERQTGKSIEMDLKVDPELLGGIRAKVGSLVYDGSLRTELDRLRHTLAETR
jgi:F-type H+-transporting ATPase subunit delta